MEDKTDKIVIEGPMEEVERVRVALKANVEELLSKLTFADIVVDPKYHKHIIGTNISLVKWHSSKAVSCLFKAGEVQMSTA